MGKLERLAESEGLFVVEMLEQATFDAVSPGICKRPDCDYTTTVEPDCTEGWCEACEANTVVSALVLAIADEEQA